MRHHSRCCAPPLQVLSDVPVYMARELQLFRCRHVISHVPLFADCSQAFAAAIVRHLIQQVCSALLSLRIASQKSRCNSAKVCLENDYLMHEGDMAEEMVSF